MRKCYPEEVNHREVLVASVDYYVCWFQQHTSPITNMQRPFSPHSFKGIFIIGAFPSTLYNVSLLCWVWRPGLWASWASTLPLNYSPWPFDQNVFFVLFCLRAEALSRNLAQHLWEWGWGLHRVNSLEQALFTAAKWLAGGRFHTNKRC